MHSMLFFLEFADGYRSVGFSFVTSSDQFVPLLSVGFSFVLAIFPSCLHIYMDSCLLEVIACYSLFITAYIHTILLHTPLLHCALFFRPSFVFIHSSLHQLPWQIAFCRTCLHSQKVNPHLCLSSHMSALCTHIYFLIFFGLWMTSLICR